MRRETYQMEVMKKSFENVVETVVETRRRKNVTTRLLGVSFGSYRRRRRDVLMGRRGYVPLRLLGDVPLRRRWVFHLRLI